MSKLDVTIGGYTYKDVYIIWKRYHDMTPRMDLYDDEGCVCTVSVWLDEPPAPGCIWVKDWSENAGVLKSLTSLAILKPTGKEHNINFVTAKEAKIL
jgi:hypothetical protein